MKARLLEFLHAENISQSAFADKIGVTRASVSHILAGRNKPSFDFISGIMDCYPKLNITWLMKGTGRMYSSTESENPATTENPVGNSQGMNEINTEGNSNSFVASEEVTDLFSSFTPISDFPAKSHDGSPAGSAAALSGPVQLQESVFAGPPAGTLPGATGGEHGVAASRPGPAGNPDAVLSPEATTEAAGGGTTPPPKAFTGLENTVIPTGPKACGGNKAGISRVIVLRSDGTYKEMD